LGPDTAICEGHHIVLDAFTGNDVSYHWQDGSTASTFDVSAGGEYVVSASKGDCSISDTIAITTIIPLVSILENDTTICNGERIMLHAFANPESHFYWNVSQSNLEISGWIDKAGIYVVNAANICGTFSDSIRVDFKECPCIVLVPNAFTPNGDGTNDVLNLGIRCPNITGYKFVVYNRYSQKAFESSNPEQSWDGFMNGRPADVGTYFYHLKYKDQYNNTVQRKGDILLLK
ncbi:MAG: gliding motility-associated C-terminal domain-containing protein, partial [Sphingobacteriales bacterium]